MPAVSSDNDLATASNAAVISKHVAEDLNHDVSCTAEMARAGACRVPRRLTFVRNAEPGEEEWSVIVVLGMLLSVEPVVLGDISDEGTWYYDERVNMSEPWAQRSLAELCTKALVK